MAEIVTLQLPPYLAQRAKEIAALNHQQLEDLLIEFIDRAITELPIESLQAGASFGFMWHADGNWEGQLNQVETQQLQELMQVYRRGLVRKARALKVAVERGLKY